ncbi:carbohydrate kinase family protein [Nocardia uniformis]|nr:PfkB family carbohydrate kinase [Nocardia uniformis]
MLAVRNILSRLGKRSGLSPERLRDTEIDVDALLNLPIVHRYATTAGLSPAEAVHGVITYAARQLPLTERLIVDAELALGLLRDNPPNGVDLDRLYAAELGDRRRYLIERWCDLHESLGAETTPRTPTERTLRGEPERRAFTALAQLITAGPAFGASAIASNGGAEGRARGRVTVLGDAVIDHIYVVDRMPEPGSSMWVDFQRSPGGKGLNRAVAVARLGLRAQLLAAVGGDPDGHEILAYLRMCGVETNLVGVVERARTPITAVIMPAVGHSANLAFKEDRLRLHPDDLDTPETRAALTTADVVLLTFEQPVDVIVRALEIVAAGGRSRVIVSASPPLNGSPRKLYRSLRSVHYLIGTPDELARLASEDASGADDAVERLLVLGVDTVCTIDGFQLTIRSRRGELVVPEPATAMAGSAGAYAAFSAALAYRLAVGGQPAREPDFLWAAAAMTATQSVSTIAEVMPSVAEIDRLMPVDTTRETH